MYRSLKMPDRTVALIVSCLLLATACGTGDTPAPRRADAKVAVVAHAVELRREVLRIEAVGTSRARRTAQIYPKTGGEVVEVLFNSGDHVDAGAALLRLESNEQELAVRLARVEVQNAEQLLARYRRIEGTGAVSDSQIDEAQTAVDAARIALDQAELALAERTVHAPFSGHLGLTHIDPGARITSSTPITQLDDREVLFVDFLTPEEVFERIRIDGELTVAPFADAGSELTARVVGIDNHIDASNRAFTVRAQLDNSNDRLRPGMSFRIYLNFPGTAYPAVPEAAVLWGTDGPYLWRLNGDRVRRANVEIVAREAGHVLVRGDLEAGTEIVLEGIQKVRDGTLITRLDPAASLPFAPAPDNLIGGSE